MVLHLYKQAIQFQHLLTSGLKFILDLTGGFQFLFFSHWSRCTIATFKFKHMNRKSPCVNLKKLVRGNTLALK